MYVVKYCRILTGQLLTNIIYRMWMLGGGLGGANLFFCNIATIGGTDEGREEVSNHRNANNEWRRRSLYP